MTRSRLLVGILGLTLSLAACSPAAAPNGPGNQPAAPSTPGATLFTASLNGANFTPAIPGAGKGTAMIELSPDKSKLTGTVTVSDLSGPVVAAHIHKGGANVSGEIAKDLVVNGNSATFSWAKGDANQPFTDAMLSELMAGRLYFNFHTAANSGGEIRGQIMPR